MPQKLPPGPRFLVSRIRYISAPPICVFIGTSLLRTFGGVPLPTFAVALAYLLSFPLFLFGRRAWEDIRTRRAAASRGAIVPPLAKRGVIMRGGGKSYPRDFLFRLCETYGYSFMLKMAFSKRLFTVEPEHVKAILATDFASFEKDVQFLGVGVFNADGDLWKFHRSMTRPFFNEDRIGHFDIFDRHATDALQQMKARMREGYAVDWQDLVARFTLDSATEFLFGTDVRSLSKGLPYPPTAKGRLIPVEDNDFASAFLKAQIASAARGRLQDVWGLREFWKDKVLPHTVEVDKIVIPILEGALRKKAERAAAGLAEFEEISDEDTLLSSLVKLTDDRRLIRDEIANILLAGRDTTACTLTFAIYRLAEHPDILQRLREEILSVVGLSRRWVCRAGGSVAPVGLSRRPSHDDIRKMKSLRAVINETLRLYPPVPLNVRHATKDTVLPATATQPPIFVPAGTNTAYSVFIVHRRKDLWGPDALKFDLDRFLDERVQKYLTPNPFIFLPFNAGPCICLGQQFAYNEASFMLVRLLQQFSAIEFVPEVAPESVVPPGYADSPGSDAPTESGWRII